MTVAKSPSDRRIQEAASDFSRVASNLSRIADICDGVEISAGACAALVEDVTDLFASLDQHRAMLLDLTGKAFRRKIRKFLK